MIFWPMHYEGVSGMPRRYYDYSAWESFKQFSVLNSTISVVVVLLFFVQIVFVLNLALSSIVGKKLRD